MVSIAAGVTRRLGGPMGRLALTASGIWAYLLAFVSFLICMVRQIPCQFANPNSSLSNYDWMCYTDITALYYVRHQVNGAIPYVSADWEYPVLTGYFASIANTISRLFGAKLEYGIDGAQMATNANIYFAVTAVGLFACLIWLISSTLKIAPNNPKIAMMIAISPAIMTTALINWDLFVVALTAAGLASWVNKKPMWAGLWWGLAVAAKLYPIVIIGALVILALRRDRDRDWESLVNLINWAKMASISALVWFLVNLPVMVTHQDGWEYFYKFNAGRGADLGSLWYGLSLAGLGLNNPIIWSRTLMILGYLGLAALIYLAPKPPDSSQIATLAVAIFLLGNLVYSPQYVLWLLPLLVLARPYLADIIMFTVAEVIYFVFIWFFLDSADLTLGLTQVPLLYITSIFIRCTVTMFVCAIIVSDIIVSPTPMQ